MDRIGAINARANTAAQKLADKFRAEVVVPICKKHDLAFLAGNGTMAFFGRHDDQEISIGNAIDAEVVLQWNAAQARRGAVL